MRFKYSTALTAVLLAGAVAAVPDDSAADEHTVSMKGGTFLPRTLRIQPGDIVRFVNDDSVAHSVYSLTPGHFFTSGRRAPGRHAVFVFNRPGAFEVMSAARYDTMKLRVEVASR